MQVNCLGAIKTKFHSKIDLTATAHYEALHPTFHEFEVNTGQDPEDLVGLFEDENVMERGDNLPGCLEQSDYSDSGDDTTDSEAEFDFEQEGFNVFSISGFQACSAGSGKSVSNIATSHSRPSGYDREAPSVKDTKASLEVLHDLLHPRRKTGRGYISLKLDSFVRRRMEAMEAMMNFYSKDGFVTYKGWRKSSIYAAAATGHGLNCARRLRRLCRQFIQDHSH